MRFRLERVRAMPAQLQPGVLYVSEEFDTAAHLCACGCGSKVRTPLGATEWTFADHPDGPSLDPSVGNWQRPCQAHYWIDRGTVEWSAQWTPQQIEAGRAAEVRRRDVYYTALVRAPWWQRLWNFLGSLRR
ncbi:DUF6527 family protein [Glacieibacterium frigidum]|uniref:Uncharacterized protein n=1 Tax=Glacieibacterium frigidum TaxID=2593303 RepID=A0A552U9E1_9SPHN|nr:hypothetical protein FMM06_14270 [Glacieibacterium frigidum]